MLWICRDCGRPYAVADGCVDIPITVAGVAVDRITYGAEPGLTGTLRQGHLLPAPECRDCGCKLGSYHHWGCCVEECPVCRGQLLTCNCPDLVEDDAEGVDAGA